MLQIILQKNHKLNFSQNFFISLKQFRMFAQVLKHLQDKEAIINMGGQSNLCQQLSLINDHLSAMTSFSKINSNFIGTTCE